MPLDPEYVAIADARLAEEAGLAAVGLGICWPNTSPFGSGTAIPVLAGETLGEAADRLALRWAPRWLLDAGFEASDAAGQATSDTQAATVTGPISWTPEVRTCRVEDQIANTTAAGTPRYERRLAGEVALLGLWHQAAQASGLDDVRPEGDLDGNTRGTRFRDFLVHLLNASLPPGWDARHEVPLTSIRGLHMRRGVGGRKSDIVVIDDGGRLVAVVSSKWTWRSDRGTEAAQMVPLRQFRPDVPYTLVTAEFARAKVVARESIEDRAYHLCPQWVGAWLAVGQSDDPRVEFPTLVELAAEGRIVADNMGMAGLHHLISDLRDSGTIL